MSDEYSYDRCVSREKRIENLEHTVNGNSKDGLTMKVTKLEIWKDTEEKRKERQQRKIDAFTVVLFTQSIAFLYWFLKVVIN